MTSWINEIIDNISKTICNRHWHGNNGRLIGNRTCLVVVRTAQTPVTLNEPEGHFCAFKPLQYWQVANYSARIDYTINLHAYCNFNCIIETRASYDLTRDDRRSCTLQKCCCFGYDASSYWCCYSIERISSLAPPPRGVQSIVMSSLHICVLLCLFVCLFVCLSVWLSFRWRNTETKSPIFTKLFVPVTCGHTARSSWRRCDMLSTSGLVDDVTF